MQLCFVVAYVHQSSNKASMYETHKRLSTVTLNATSTSGNHI